MAGGGTGGFSTWNEIFPMGSDHVPGEGPANQSASASFTHRTCNAIMPVYVVWVEMVSIVIMLAIV